MNQGRLILRYILGLVIVVVMVVGIMFVIQNKKAAQTALVGKVTSLPKPKNICLSSALNPTSSSIKITSPNGGETYYEGQTFRVVWQACNLPQNAAVSLSFEYVPDAGQPLPPTANITTVNIMPATTTGYQDFFIPNNYTPPGYLNFGVPFGRHFIVRAKLNSYSGANPGSTGTTGTFTTVAQDSSDSLFTINPFTPALAH